MARRLRIGYPNPGNYSLSCEYGTYSQTGQAATLTKTTPGAYSLTSASGSYALNGQTATLTYGAVGGTLVDGSTLAISGSFGTRSDYNDGNYTFAGIRHIHKRFTRFENNFPANGSSQATFMDDSHGKGFFPAGASFGFQSTPSADGLSIETGGPSQSGKYFRKTGNSFADEGEVLSDVTLATPADMYICYKTRGGSGAKIWRLWHTNDSHDVFLGTGGIFRDDRGGGSWPYDGTAFFSGASTGWTDSTSVWNRHELILSVANSSRLRVSGTLVVAEVYIGGNPSTDSTIPMITSDDNGQAVHLSFPNSVDNGLNRDFADIYIDYTAARVEVTAPNGKVEIQPVNSWSSGSITIIGNKGEMDAGSGTLRVYNSSDSLIHTQSVTIA